ncbi:polysaccharide biosynthesis/export family protein [uncultured Lentibacter sp.]|uniref:polysaccharide biosynthesis/export family protein n=1 Tax=uncultured Lentibacter sp. TaxID=1659309 RepID=UPI0026392F5B|nr:polysaccharide biosynthesis/export family protein [uncultured Lentibacter sp.]
MRLFARFGLLACLSLSLAACSLPRGAALVQEVVRETRSQDPSFQVVPVTRAALPDIASWPRTGATTPYSWPSATRGSNADTIRAGDSIDLIIWDSDANSLLTGAGSKSTDMRGLRVSPAGTVFVPYLDEVVVSGFSSTEARRHIQQRLTEISPSAQVQLMLSAGQQNSVDLVAGVGKPGSYPLPSKNTSILSVLSLAGGIDQGLRNPLVRLNRANRSYAVRAEKLYTDQSLNTVLRGGDKIIVREDDRYFTALGATGTETIVPFDQETITAMEALSRLGGLSDARANLKAVLVLREYSAAQTGAGPGRPELAHVVFTFDLTHADGLFAARSFEIAAGDTILATESAVTAARSLFGLIGSAFGLATTLSGS